MQDERKRCSKLEAELLKERTARAQAEDRAKEAQRSATAVTARAWAEMKHAYELVHGEEGEIVETPIGRGVALMSKMLDVRAGSSSSAARAAAEEIISRYAEVEALAPIPVGAFVWYMRASGTVVPAKVVEVDGGRPDEAESYAIRFDCDVNGPSACARLTECNRITRMY